MRKGGGSRHRERPQRRIRAGGHTNLEGMASQHQLMDQQPVALSSLGQFTPNMRQGDRKRYQKGNNNLDGSESEFGGVNLDLDATSFDTRTSHYPPQQFFSTNTTTTASTPTRETIEYSNKNSFNSLGQLTHPTLPYPNHHHLQSSSINLNSFNPNTQRSSQSQASSIAPDIVQGINDYSLLRVSTEKAAELNAVMATLENIFDVEEWDPELPSAPDPDASPERLTVKPEPLTYTTVGSVVKPTDARQFTAPNRIQREGRGGLEIGNRRPLLNMSNSARGPEFFSNRNTPQFPINQSYGNAHAHGFVPEQSPAQQYDSPQYSRPSLPSAHSSTDNYTASPAGRQSLVRNRSTSVNYQIYGAQNYSQQEQSSRQAFLQENPSTSQNPANHTIPIGHQTHHAHQPMLEQSTKSLNLTSEEEEVLKKLGLSLPMAPTIPREANHAGSGGKSFQHELTPIQQSLLASLQERSGNTHQLSSEDDISGIQRPILGMNHDSNVSTSSSNVAARLHDAKMSTVQSLAQFPNPDQEHAKARLAELAASRMRGNENQRPGQLDQRNDFNQQPNMQVMNESGVEFRMPFPHQDSPTGVELDYEFRFPPSATYPTQQMYNSANNFTVNEKIEELPRKTPQGYPQPLTAGPPGQRQNTGPSSNKALNSMQQMLANGNQRSASSTQQYPLPQKSIYPPPTQAAFASRSSDIQRSISIANVVPDEKTYPWTKLDRQPREYTDGAPPRVRETLSYDDAKKYYPNGMDLDTVRTFIVTLSPEEALKHYPTGMDEGTKKWYEEERKWQQQKLESDLGSLLDGSIPFQQWYHSSSQQNNM